MNKNLLNAVAKILFAGVAFGLTASSANALMLYKPPNGSFGVVGTQGPCPGDTWCLVPLSPDPLPAGANDFHFVWDELPDGTFQSLSEWDFEPNNPPVVFSNENQSGGTKLPRKDLGQPTGKGWWTIKGKPAVQRVPAPVPAPLPLLGVGLAFRNARKLREMSKKLSASREIEF
jgi:hypothetical protein